MSVAASPGAAHIPTHRSLGARLMNTKPTYLSKEGLAKLRAEHEEMVSVEAAGGRPAHPRRQGARRPVGERRVRGRQERAGVRRGPDPDARGAHQERDDHRREPLDRPRPDRLDGRPRKHGRGGDLHHRRLGGSQARRGAHLQREPGRSRPPRQEEGREGRRAGPGRGYHLQGRRHQLSTGPASGPVRRHAWTGRTNSRHGSGTTGRRSSTTRRRRQAPSTSAACVVRSSSTPSPGRCALPASRRRSCTASTTSTRWTPRRS